MDRLISEQAVFENIDTWVKSSEPYDGNGWLIPRHLYDRIKAIPSAKPKTGHWIKGYIFPDGSYWKCDKCNELIKVKIPMRYCNNCGAKMQEAEE